MYLQGKIHFTTSSIAFFLFFKELLFLKNIIVPTALDLTLTSGASIIVLNTAVGTGVPSVNSCTVNTQHSYHKKREKPFFPEASLKNKFITTEFEKC